MATRTRRHTNTRTHTHSHIHPRTHTQACAYKNNLFKDEEIAKKKRCHCCWWSRCHCCCLRATTTQQQQQLLRGISLVPAAWHWIPEQPPTHAQRENKTKPQQTRNSPKNQKEKPLAALRSPLCWPAQASHLREIHSRNEHSQSSMENSLKN